MSQDNEGTAPVKSTEVLTVWRELHAEIESMGQVSNNTKDGLGVISTSKDQSNNTTDVTVDLELDKTGDKGRFENGVLIDMSDQDNFFSNLIK